MPLVLKLPGLPYQLLGLHMLVYWTILTGHAASGYGFLVGIPLLPMLILQIALLIHVWNSMVDSSWNGVSASPVRSTRSSKTSSSNGEDTFEHLSMPIDGEGTKGGAVS